MASAGTFICLTTFRKQLNRAGCAIQDLGLLYNKIAYTCFVNMLLIYDLIYFARANLINSRKLSCQFFHKRRNHRFSITCTLFIVAMGARSRFIAILPDRLIVTLHQHFISFCALVFVCKITRSCDVIRWI